jgi:hypothetical protein
MNELTAGRMANDVVGRRAKSKCLTNMVKEMLDHKESPLRLRLKMSRRIRHISEGISVARVVPLSKLGNEEYKVVVFREGGADIARLLAGAAAAVHQKQYPWLPRGVGRSVVPDTNRWRPFSIIEFEAAANVLECFSVSCLSSSYERLMNKDKQKEEIPTR